MATSCLWYNWRIILIAHARPWLDEITRKLVECFSGDLLKQELVPPTVLKTDSHLVIQETHSESNIWVFRTSWNMSIIWQVTHNNYARAVLQEHEQQNK